MASTKCPYCAEEIQAEAVKCKHCKSWLTGTPDAGPHVQQTLFGGAENRLVRTSGNKMISGVCGGIGKYLGIDPTLVRVFFAVASFFTAIFPGASLYLILTFVIPSDDAVTV